MPSHIEYNLENLTNAIVKQAAEDYRKALKGRGYDGKSPAKIIKEVEQFFHSKYFELLTTVKGDYLIERLKEEYEEEKKKMRVRLIQATPNPIETIAKIASICYDSDPKDPMKLVRHLYYNGHLSVFEHIYFTFKIEEISRACSHQLVRHRHCSFTQRSQRYCSEDECTVIAPRSILDKDEKGGYWELIETIGEHYRELQALGIPNEDVRYLLPNACATELYLSCNLRELIHIANERLCTKAQWEIRDLVRNMVSLVDPSLQFMLVPKCKSGRIICHTPCQKKEG